MKNFSIYALVALAFMSLGYQAFIGVSHVCPDESASVVLLMHKEIGSSYSGSIITNRLDIPYRVISSDRTVYDLTPVNCTHSQQHFQHFIMYRMKAYDVQKENE